MTVRAVGLLLNRYATIGGGWNSKATGDYSAVAGGYQNMAAGAASFTGGGSDNSASGDYSVALGSRAHATHDNSAVLGLSAAVDHTCSSVGPGTLNICADHGVYINDQRLSDVSFLTKQIDYKFGQHFVADGRTEQHVDAVGQSH